MATVVVLGAGALGSLYGAFFAAGGHTVTLVARPAHAAAVSAGGLRVRGRDGNVRTVGMRAVDDPTAAPSADIVVLASKAQDTEALLSGYARDAGAAFSIQNGARQAEPLIERFGAAAVACSSMVGATLDSPGAISHTFDGVTYLGDLASSSPGRSQAIVGALEPHAACAVRDDIGDVLWSKAVLAVAAMGVSSLIRLPYHQVFRQAGNRVAFLRLVVDAAAVARAEGATLLDLPGPLQAGTLVSLPEAEALDRLRSIGDTMVATGQTQVRVSMLQSIESGRPLEVGAVFSGLVELADRHSLEVANLRLVTSLLESIDAVHRESM